jgi:hypothetical protein
MCVSLNIEQCVGVNELRSILRGLLYLFSGLRKNFFACLLQILQQKAA